MSRKQFNHITLTMLGATLLVATLWAGCSHYRLGQSGDLPFDSLYVAAVKNESYAPQADAVLSADLRKAFLASATDLELTQEEDAQATLNVVIIDYRRTIAATQEDDTELARSFNVSMTARCTLHNNQTGATYFKNRVVNASVEVFVDSGFTQSEYQNLPILTRELARRIRDTVVNVW